MSASSLTGTAPLSASLAAEPLPEEVRCPVDLPSLTHAIPTQQSEEVVLFDASSCRTGVHALKAFEEWLEERAALKHQYEDQTLVYKQNLELNLAALVLGQRQLQRFVQIAHMYGYTLQCLKSEALVTRQLAMQQQLPLAPSTAATQEERSERSVASLSLKNKTSASLQSPGLGMSLGMSLATKPRLLDHPLHSTGHSAGHSPGKALGVLLHEQTRCVQVHLRSGQSLEFEGNIVLIGDAHRGSEIRATGNIIVWGELLGLAHAGCLGDTSAEIRALKLDPLQLRIADVIARRPDQWTHEPCLSGESLNHKPHRDPLWRGEIARIVEGEIQLLHVTGA